MKEIFVYLRQTDIVVKTAEPCSDRRIARILAYIPSNLADRLTLDKLSKEAGISKYHFVKLFRRATGQTPIDFVTTLRLEKARQLLCTTELSVGEIAALCGYARPTHFAAAFSGRYGISPSMVRKEPAGNSA